MDYLVCPDVSVYEDLVAMLGSNRLDRLYGVKTSLVAIVRLSIRSYS